MTIWDVACHLGVGWKLVFDRFRDKEFFKLRIYALHETRHGLVG